ncbi:MAG: M48 family metallopeptidase [Candidatus Omnitrophota bacterium]
MQDSNNAKRYAKVRHNLAIFETAFTILFLLAIQFSGISLCLKTLALHLSSREFILIAVYLISLGIVFNALTFWMDFFGGFWLERRFGLLRQNLASWLKDHIKRLLIGGVFCFIVIEALYYLLRKFPFTWWLWGGFFWFVFSLLLAKIFPVLIVPLFYKLEKLQDENLKADLLCLADNARIKILEIYKIGLGAKTKKANAALTGFGSSKRILLSDTLLNNYSKEEIEAVLAHEMAHHKYRHIWKLILLNLASTVAAFLLIYIIHLYIIKYALGLDIHDISGFPVLAALFICFSFFTTPLLNAVSRHFESQADTEAIRLTANPQAFISLMEKLTQQNLSDPAPSRLVEIFFYDHPPASKRIKAARGKIV